MLSEDEEVAEEEPGESRCFPCAFFLLLLVPAFFASERKEVRWSSVVLMHSFIFFLEAEESDKEFDSEKETVPVDKEADKVVCTGIDGHLWTLSFECPFFLLKFHFH